MSKKEILVVIVVIVILSILAWQVLRNSEINENGVPEEDKNYCPEESRGADVCIAVYDPVCGWSGPEIKCLVYPCAQTFSNSCFACIDENVLFWTRGECPS
jgi:hypothetical protein|tara:strand:+ start:1119 stop:1421 length:303 start_codon:yes stop_codon:yes gene_type:complete